MRNIEGKVLEAEWSEINENTGIEKVHEHKMYILNDNGEEVIFDTFNDKTKSIGWIKVSNF